LATNRAALVLAYGNPPSEDDFEASSLWVAALAPLASQSKINLLKTQDTLKRMEAVIEAFAHYIGRRSPITAAAAAAAESSQTNEHEHQRQPTQANQDDDA
jgi:hypothetical protein